MTAERGVNRMFYRLRSPYGRYRRWTVAAMLLFTFSSAIVVASEDAQLNDVWRLIDFSADLEMAVFADPEGGLQRIQSQQAFAAGEWQLQAVASDQVLLLHRPANSSGIQSTRIVLRRGEYLPNLTLAKAKPRYQYQVHAVVIEGAEVEAPAAKQNQKQRSLDQQQ